MKVEFTTTEYVKRHATNPSQRWEDHTHEIEAFDWIDFQSAIDAHERNSRHWCKKPTLTEECLEFPLPPGGKKEILPSGKVEITIPVESGEIFVEKPYKGKIHYTIKK